MRKLIISFFVNKILEVQSNSTAKISRDPKMNFTRAVYTGFSKFATFKGRASRSEFWWWNLFGFACAIFAIAVFPETDFTGTDKEMIKSNPLLGFIYVILLIPNMAIFSRRLHDVNKSYWWVLSVFPPLVFMFFDSTPGENRFGPNPNGETIAADIPSSKEIGLHLGDVVYTKIEGIKIFSAPESTSSILITCSKGEEFIYKGEVNSDFLKVSNANFSGWVETIMVSKKIE